MMSPWCRALVATLAGSLVAVSAGCSARCFTTEAGYEVTGKPVGAETGEPLANVSVSLRVEDENGRVHGPEDTTTWDDASNVGAGLFGSRILTDTAELCISELVCILSVGGAAYARPPGLEDPPTATRVILDVTVGDAVEGLVIDLDEADPVFEADCGPGYVIYSIALGTVSVPQGRENSPGWPTRQLVQLCRGTGRTRENASTG